MQIVDISLIVNVLSFHRDSASRHRIWTELGGKEASPSPGPTQPAQSTSKRKDIEVRERTSKMYHNKLDMLKSETNLKTASTLNSPEGSPALFTMLSILEI